jgi:PEGA domain
MLIDIGVLLLVAAAAAVYFSRPSPKRPPARESAPAPLPAPTTDRGARATKPPASTAPRRPSERPTAPTEAAPAPELPARPRLRVESDVPGALVFIDRQFAGKTPFESRDVTPGTHRIQVSAEGYEGVTRTVEIGDETVEVNARLKDVRLNVSVEVVHKHAIGSCRGTLFADLKGLRYDTSNDDDRFSLAFAELETFDLDYVKKNLRVKRRGGRMWNFTTSSDNADPLLVFHRTVEQARKKM